MPNVFKLHLSTYVKSLNEHTSLVRSNWTLLDISLLNEASIISEEKVK